MAIAGKVAITLSTENGGAWSADVTYDRLVAVKHNNNLYISRKTVANVEPPNDEFWFLAMEGFSGEDIENIIDGTTQVGNAKTLDGHEAEYFVDRGQKLNTSILDKALEVGNGVHHFSFSGASTSTEDLPDSIYRYGSATVIKRNETAITVVVWGSANNSGTHFLPKFNYYANGAWSGWKGLDDFLPLTGGKATSEKIGEALTIMRNTSDGGSYLTFENLNGLLGYLGINEDKKPIFRDSDSTNRELLHTGNKPTGTYTGNGSAESRTIQTGALFSSNGGACIVYNNSGIAIVTHKGATSFTDSGVNRLSAEEAKYLSGNIVLNTSDAVLNAGGSTTTYIVV